MYEFIHIGICTKANVRFMLDYTIHSTHGTHRATDIVSSCDHSHLSSLLIIFYVQRCLFMLIFLLCVCQSAKAECCWFFEFEKAILPFVNGPYCWSGNIIITQTYGFFLCNKNPSNTKYERTRTHSMRSFEPNKYMVYRWDLCIRMVLKSHENGFEHLEEKKSVPQLCT